MNPLNFRLYQPDDLQAVWIVFRDARVAIGDDRPVSLDDMRLFFQMQGFTPAQDAFIVEQAGQIVAYADIQFMQEAGSCWSRGIVHPDYGHQGIGAAIIRYTEAHFLKRTANLPLDQALIMQRQTFDSNPAAMRLLEREGYHLLHVFYAMRIDLDQPVEIRPLAPNLILRPLNSAQEAYALYEASQEAFADHWGFEFMTYEVWQERVLSTANGDFSLWLIAWEDSEIAGFSLCDVIGEGNDAKGEISSLAVRAGWRKQGLGLALLKASFAQLQAHGCRTVILGVDATNATHAVALYQRAGMQVDKRTLYYRKVLRGTAEA